MALTNLLKILGFICLGSTLIATPHITFRWLTPSDVITPDQTLISWFGEEGKSYTVDVKISNDWFNLPLLEVGTNTDLFLSLDRTITTDNIIVREIPIIEATSHVTTIITDVIIINTTTQSNSTSGSVSSTAQQTSKSNSNSVIPKLTPKVIKLTPAPTITINPVETWEVK